jgi:hypothetical protein
MRGPVLVSSVVQYAAVSLECADVLQGFGFELCSNLWVLECAGLILSYECSSIIQKSIYLH